MNMKKLLSWIPGWLGLLLLIVVGVLMLVHGAANPLDANLDDANRAGFVIFGLCAIVVGAFSWIAIAKSDVKDRVGEVGVLVELKDLPWWGWVVDGAVVALSVVLFVAIS